MILAELDPKFFWIMGLSFVGCGVLYIVTGRTFGIALFLPPYRGDLARAWGWICITIGVGFFLAALCI